MNEAADDLPTNHFIQENPMSIKKLIQAALLIAAALCLLNSQSAFALGGKLLDQTGCTCCPVCDHVCKLTAEQVDEDKTCFDVESKVICIPRVVFPWQRAKKAACASCDSCDGNGCNACVHNGARVRKVCVLTTQKYTCPACEYTWKAEKKDCCGCGAGNCCGGSACDGGCVCDTGCDSGCAAAPAPPTAPAVDVLPTPTPAPQASIHPGDYYRQPRGVSAVPQTLSLPLGAY